MEKTLTIDGRPVEFKSTAAFLMRYKQQFRRDALQDILKLQEAFTEGTAEIKNLEAFDLEVFFNIAWALAKTADRTIPNPMDWLDTFSEFPIADIMPELLDMALASINSTTVPKKK
jgi:hypothetical protein